MAVEAGRTLAAEPETDAAAEEEEGRGSPSASGHLRLTWQRPRGCACRLALPRSPFPGEFQGQERT